ncbi:MAG: hypothetical protein F2681_03815 [Actinobacteria bacterium]|uniref:Unannotated protein n=1 Tax=freshwater metagenome TaxID=449393 RepID=A0A6J6A4P2_9ZZZZ|nr:hypothetical protein [Actinomycetota bacterium]MSW76802.1 hypothetical protein [Actinomycetota bacterium]MSX54751.1 hypothetical protein [Actinomycetota bacterium]MSZ82249.1 hypothetical protein [Actinomycetota bacterium]MTB17088.1 hypothetical protein [Actinomycetota bacterium]
MRPITRGLLAGLTVSTFALAGCSSDSKTAATTTTEAAADDTAAADEPATTNAPATPATVTGGSAEITVTVGVDDFETSGGTRVVSVPKGTNVTLSLTNPDADESYHLHGYDLEQDAAKGATAKITFTADQSGRFDVESHNTEATLLVLVVV